METHDQPQWKTQLASLKSQLKQRERDRQIRSQRDSDIVESPQLTEFLKWQVQYQQDLAKKCDPVMFIPTKTDESFDNQPWGEWRSAYTDLRYGKSLAYATNNYIVKELLNHFNNHEINPFLFGFISLTANHAENHVLDFLVKNHDPKNITPVIAQGILQRFMTDFTDQLSTALEPVKTTALAVAISGVEKLIQQYHQQTNQTLDLIPVSLKSNVSFEKQEWSPDDNLNWIYFAVTSSCPTTTITRGISSHCPDFNFPNYYQSADNKAGILWVGEPIKFFTTDIHTTSDELALGKKWTKEEGAIIQAEMLTHSPREAEEEYKNQLEAIGDSEASSALDAWQRHSNYLYNYTEVWLDHPQSYAVWVDPEWNKGIVGRYNRNSYALMKVGHLESLLTSRPDLPVLYMGEHPKVADRDIIKNQIKTVKASWDE